MRKYLFLFLLVILIVPCAAQNGICNLTPNDAPPFFGLKLQMSPAQVKTIFGKKLKLNVKRKGTFFQNFIDNPPPAFLSGVRALYLRFFDRKLYQIEVFYQNENERESAAPTEKETLEFINRLSADLNLPANDWETKDKRFYKLTCAGFSVAADRILNPRVELTDEAARVLFEEAEKIKKN